MKCRCLRFIQALYEGSVCRVKVEGQVSGDFEVNSGLRQGCVLSPLLFSLYINGVVKRLKEEKCGVECGGETITGLLFADDMCLVASEALGLKKSLDVLVEWCMEWGVKINVMKSGIMHIRRKKAERSHVSYMLDGETIPMVSSYKYLGSVVDEFLELKEMVKDKTEAGRRALGACFQRCRAEMGDVTVGIFRKLMESLVESVMMYEAEIWGCSRHLVSIEQVQLCALRIFFGVGTLHPKASLLLEINSLPVVWEAEMCCVKFRLKVLTSRCGNGVWIRNKADFELQSVGGDAIANLTDSEIGAMLSCAA